MKLTINSNLCNKNLVIVSHSTRETITDCIIANRHNFDVNIQVITLEDLLFSYEIFDEVNDDCTHIRWYNKDQIFVSNASYLLLNRVMYVPDNLFVNFITSDIEYAKRELEAYIGFAFNAFVGIGNKSSNGMCVNSTSLPQQWNTIKQSISITIPNYYWGPYYNNLLNHKDNLVYSHIYDFLNWTTTDLDLGTDGNIFCFEKPIGSPVFIFSIGDKYLFTSDIILSESLKDRLKQLSKQINQIFNHFISEILIFVNDVELIFGCINHSIIRSHKNLDFNNFICENFLQEFYECAN